MVDVTATSSRYNNQFFAAAAIQSGFDVGLELENDRNKFAVGIVSEIQYLFCL